jgi:hypothetical protein
LAAVSASVTVKVAADIADPRLTNLSGTAVITGGLTI